MFDISAPSRVSHSTINTRFTAIESSHIELRLPYRPQEESFDAIRNFR